MRRKAASAIGILVFVSACTQPVTVTTTTPMSTSTTYAGVTAFAETTECDPLAQDADVQVVQAFVTAYNQRDSQRLSELVPETDEIWDVGGVPHLGTHLWTDIVAWAEKGWEVDDHLQLVHMVRYGPEEGSDITVVRRNEVLMADGIPELTLLIKVPSSGCRIERLIGGVTTYEPGGCEFFESYIEELTALNIGTEIPAICASWSQHRLLGLRGGTRWHGTGHSSVRSVLAGRPPTTTDTHP